MKAKYTRRDNNFSQMATVCFPRRTVGSRIGIGIVFCAFMVFTAVMVLPREAIAKIYIVPESPPGMTYRENEVKFYLASKGYTIELGKYDITGFSITDGEDPHKLIYIGRSEDWSGNTGSIIYYIGRKGSVKVANWWKENFTAYQSTFGHDPEKLNFAFIGNLSLTITGGIFGSDHVTLILKNIGIAQGHAGLSNNWWFGGKSCHSGPPVFGPGVFYCDAYSTETTLGGVVRNDRKYAIILHRGGLGSSVNAIGINTSQLGRVY